MEKKLAEVESTPVYTHFEWVAMRGIARIGWLVVSTMELILLLALLAVAGFELMTGKPIPTLLVLSFMVLYGWNVLKGAAARRMFHEAVIEGTEKGRAEMRESIAKLKGKLAKKEPPRKYSSEDSPRPFPILDESLFDLFVCRDDSVRRFRCTAASFRRRGRRSCPQGGSAEEK